MDTEDVVPTPHDWRMAVYILTGYLVDEDALVRAAQAFANYRADLVKFAALRREEG